MSVVASTDAVDSYGEIVEQSWDLARFRTNPVVLFGHNSRELPIGTAEDIGVRNGQLEATIKFVSAEANPLAEQVWKLVQERALRAVSVGFMPRTVRSEKRNGEDVYVLADNELHELSVVPIPANPEALAKMKAKAIAAAGTDNQPAGKAATQEDRMDLKELQAENARLTAEKSVAEKQATEAKTSQTAAETKFVTLDASLSRIVVLLASVGLSLKADQPREAQVEAAIEGLVKETSDLRAKTIEQEVEALVGVKITPAEKADFVELRKSNPALFAKMVAGRAEMKQLGGPVIGDDKAAPEPVVSTPKGANGADLSNKIFGA